MSVQARIRIRREQRRAAAIRDAYAHLYEVYAGTGYLRFTPGSTLQRLNYFPAWDAGFTRFYSERLGVTLDGRGYYGGAFIGPNYPTNTAVYKPTISTYAAMAGPTYRFYLKPKYSAAARVMAGFAYGNFSGDLSGFKPEQLGLYPDGVTYALNASVIADYNISPTLAVRVAPEYLATGFGSTVQNSLGFTAGIAYRFGKQ
jgi:hypothetical protein